MAADLIREDVGSTGPESPAAVGENRTRDRTGHQIPTTADRIQDR